MSDTPPLTLAILTRRHRLAVQAMESAVATAGCPLQVVIAFDDAPREVCEAMSVLLHCSNVRSFLLPVRHYYVRGMNALYHDMRTPPTSADKFVVINDDVLFTMRDWGPYVLDQYAQRFPDGGVLELAGPDLCAHYISDVGFMDKMYNGRLADPRYTMYYSDSHLMRHMKKLGRYAYCPGPSGNPVIHHQVVQDALRSEVEYWMPIDRWIDRMAAQEPDQMETT
jgi:hypothetical protein